MNEEFDAILEVRPTAKEPDMSTEWAGDHWPRITVVLVSHQRKMDQEDQGLLGVLQAYEQQEYEGPNDINLVLDPLDGRDSHYTEQHLRAVGVKKADPGIVVFWDDKTILPTTAFASVARIFMEAWPEQVVIQDADGNVIACTQGHYMREIYDEVMK